MAMAHRPIGPQPMTATRCVGTSQENTVWTALPNGSWMEATSSGIVGGLRHACWASAAWAFAGLDGLLDMRATAVAASSATF